MPLIMHNSRSETVYFCALPWEKETKLHVYLGNLCSVQSRQIDLILFCLHRSSLNQNVLLITLYLNVLLSVVIFEVKANSAKPDETSHLVLHCLQYFCER